MRKYQNDDFQSALVNAKAIADDAETKPVYKEISQKKKTLVFQRWSGQTCSISRCQLSSPLFHTIPGQSSINHGIQVSTAEETP